MRNVKLEASDLDFYNKSDGKPLHVDVDEEMKTDDKIPALALLPNKSDEQKINNKGEIREGTHPEWKLQRTEI